MLGQVLPALAPDRRAALLRARENIHTNEMGYDRQAFKSVLAANASLAREYSTLHRKHGNMHALRQVLVYAVFELLAYEALSY